MSSIKLWPKQQEVFDFACSRDKVALLCEQRTGKTFITLALIEHEIEELSSRDEELVGLLVVILNNKVSTWHKNLAEHLPDLLIVDSVEELRRSKGHRILVIHFEALPRDIKKLVKFKKINWACVDEAHRLYNRGSRQSRAMARLHWIPRKIILTGTPMEKKPTDFYAQFLFLDPSVFGTNYSRFEETWLNWKKLDFDLYKGMRRGGPAWQQKVLQQRILKSKAKFREELLPEFIEKLAPYCIRITKEDVGIIPPVIRVHTIQMTPRHGELYRQLERESWVQVPDGPEILAPMPAVKAMKLRQMASGFIFDEDRELHWLSRGKIPKVVSLFESLPKPVVIFASFVPEVIRIEDRLKKLGYDVGVVYGKTPKKLRPGVWKAFQAGKMDAIVCQTSAGGVGVDLWKANHAIVASMGYSSIIWDQAKARLDSRDKKVPGTIHLVNMEGTIDEELYDLIEVKGQTTRNVLSHLKGRYQDGKGKDRNHRSQGTPASRDAQVQRRHPRR